MRVQTLPETGMCSACTHVHPENLMSPSKDILVVHYSLSGNTERVAGDLAARLGADREAIDDTRNRRGVLGYLGAALDSIRERHTEIGSLDKDPKNYSLTVIGTPIWGGKITPAVRTYLRLHRDRFNEVAFFTTAGSTTPDKVVPAMEHLAGRRARAFAGFVYADLKSPETYARKLDTFIANLRNTGPQFGEARYAPA
jgi:flavodoxin